MEGKSTKERNQVLQNELYQLNCNIKSLQHFTLPIQPKWKLKQLNVNKCKCMKSAKIPLWLEFENSDCYGLPINVLFKVGDDLRQDMLTLQVMNVMNNLWLISGHDLRLHVYEVITTGYNTGFIEIVTHSDTINNISVEYGGGSKKGPQDETTHVKYLWKHNYNNPQQLLLAQNRYIRSCAGYTIASWILGIGDRFVDCAQ